MSDKKTKRFTRIEIVLVIGVILTGSCVFCLLVFPLSSGNDIGAATAPPTKPLSEVGLSTGQLTNILGITSSVTRQTPGLPCNTEALECFETNFTSKHGDFFLLHLSRFASQDKAIDFGIGVAVGLDKKYHTVDVDIPIGSGDYRWLMLGYLGGMPVYYGGASVNGVAIYATWGRTSVMVSEQEAVQVFSRLLDAQKIKIRTTK